MNAKDRRRFDAVYRNRDAPCPWPHKSWQPADMLDESANLGESTRMLRVRLVREVCKWVKTEPKNLNQVYVDFELKKPHDIVGYFPYNPLFKPTKRANMKPILKLSKWEWANMQVKK